MSEPERRKKLDGRRREVPLAARIFYGLVMVIDRRLENRRNTKRETISEE